MDQFRYFVGTVLVAMVAGLIMAFPIMWMWNYVMPDVFGLPLVNVWQVFWGAFMIRLIFSGMTVLTTPIKTLGE